MNTTAPRFLAAAILLAALAPAQEKSHDALAGPRAKAKAQNQRILVQLTGGDDAVGEALTTATSDYRTLGKLLKYEYQVAALPASSKPAAALCERLRLRDLALPALAVLDAEDRVLDTLSAEAMVTDGAFDVAKVRTFLEKHPCEAVDAREVLAEALAVAKNSERDAFVYLSAPR